MKVLQLCNKPPYPPVDGGTLAMNSITQGLLRAGCEVRVLAVETDKHPLRREALPPEYVEQTRIEAVYVDLRPQPLPAVAAMLCGESYHVRRYVSNAFAARLRQILDEEQFDVVHVESIFLTPYVPLIRQHSKARVILRAHNVEHLIWSRLAQETPHGLRRWYMKHLALTLRAYELEHLGDYDGIVCITHDDADYFRQCGCRKSIVAIPFGIGDYETTRQEDSDSGAVGGSAAEEQGGCAEETASLFHIGAMDWLPNQQGVDWLLEEVWPVVRRQVPQAHLYLAGRKMPARLMDAHIEGVSVVGEVDDAMRFMADKQVSLVPLRSGSGIRVKIIEAMSLGKAVVSTTVGARGIACTNGEDILLADTPEAFAAHIGRLLNDDAYRQRIGSAAARLVATEYDTRQLTARLLEFYKFPAPEAPDTV